MRSLFLAFAALLLPGSSWADAARNDTETTAVTPPMVLSFAVQPVQQFNRKLQLAQQQQVPWSQDPQQISQQYTGPAFAVVKTKEYQRQLITYNVRPAQQGHPQMLIILALANSKGHWQLEKARLSWRCETDNFFSTNHCDQDVKSNTSQQ